LALCSRFCTQSESACTVTDGQNCCSRNAECMHLDLHWWRHLVTLTLTIGQKNDRLEMSDQRDCWAGTQRDGMKCNVHLHCCVDLTWRSLQLYYQWGSVGLLVG